MKEYKMKQKKKGAKGKNYVNVKCKTANPVKVAKENARVK